MSDQPPSPELLRSLGRLVRGLSALFWGLPAALIICVLTVRANHLRPSGLVPALVVLGLLFYGLWQMGDFQKQERPWRSALDRTRLLALINVGLSPFLYWWNHFPLQVYFLTGVGVLVLSSLLFLFNLNLVIARLGAMLPDETLRQETRSFTAMNRGLLVVLLLLTGVYLFLWGMPEIPDQLGIFIAWLEQYRLWVLVFLLLLPLAMTMALIWKTKEVIMDSVFGAK